MSNTYIWVANRETHRENIRYRSKITDWKELLSPNQMIEFDKNGFYIIGSIVLGNEHHTSDSPYEMIHSVIHMDIRMKITSEDKRVKYLQNMVDIFCEYFAESCVLMPLSIQATQSGFWKQYMERYLDIHSLEDMRYLFEQYGYDFDDKQYTTHRTLFE